MPATHPTPAPDPSFVLIQIAPSVDPAAVDRRLQAIVNDGGGSLLFPLDDRWYAVSRAPGKELRIVAGGTNQNLAEFIATLDGIVGIKLVPAGELVRLYEEHESKRLQTPAPPSAPNVDDWNLEAVRARAAWAKFGGWDQIAWGNIRVGHLDTGYTEHPAFGPWNSGRSPSLLPHLGSNFFDESEGPRDWLKDGGTPGHGTRTCSVLTGLDAAANFIGVAPRVPVVPYRISNFVVLDTLWWRNQRLGEAIDHAVVNAGCAVLSISMGDPCNASSEMGAAVDRAYERGVIVVAAAGNITSEVTYPGRYTRAVGVGGITSSDEPWNGASRGPAVDVSAPADLIWRGDWTRDSANQNVAVYGNRKDGSSANGTSYATVHVSAAAALWLAFHGAAIDVYRAHAWQIVEAFRSAVKSSARRPAIWDDTLFGAGILDIAALLDAPLPAPDTLVYEQRLAEREHF
jgi:subtilisin family serine protease